MFNSYLDEVAAVLTPQCPHATASAWLERALAAARVALMSDGRAAGFADSLARLPTIQIAPSALDPALEAVASAALPAAIETQLRQALMALCPWRKGPFTLAGVHIDAEWRADWKWTRIRPHLSALSGRRVLDVGCGNGYYTWRMLDAGAQSVLGLDPAVLCLAQFLATRLYLGSHANTLLTLPSAVLDTALDWFDTVFSLGVLYHRREPAEHLHELRRALRTGGELVLETLVIDTAGAEVLVPQGRYAQMRNVHAIPSCLRVERWLGATGFTDIRLVDRTPTTCAEQRATDWMTGQSLVDFLDPKDIRRTIEGYPAPVRAVFVARGE